MIKKLNVFLLLITAFFIINFPTTVEANPPSVGDCLGDNPDSECSEEQDLIETNEPESEEQIVSSDQMSGWEVIGYVFRTLFALLLVLALIYVLIKFLSRRNKLFNKVKALENLGGISVGQNKSIQIVRIGDKVFMVGVGDNVELLQEIDDDKLIEELLHSDEQPDFQVNNLVQSIFRPKANTTDVSNEEPQQNFKSLFANELDKLRENRLTLKNQQKKKED